MHSLLRTTMVALATIALLSPLQTASAQSAGEVALTDDVLMRFAAVCRDVKEARAGQTGSMAALKQVDLDAVAKKHGFAGEGETSAISMRIAMVDMYAPEDPEAQEMLKAMGTEPDMKALIDRAQADAPAVRANKEALAVCTAR